MKALFRLSWKAFFQSWKLNLCVVIQTAVILATLISIVSSAHSRFTYYTPFRELLQGEGYFCNASPAPPIGSKYVQDSNVVSELMEGVRDEDVYLTYMAMLENKGQDIMDSLTYAYDEIFYKNWIPEMESGVWFNEIQNDYEKNVIPVVIYDEADNYDVAIGDRLTKYYVYWYFDENNIEQSELRPATIEIVGRLSSEAEVVYYDIHYTDCRGIFRDVHEICEEFGQTLFFTRSSDIKKSDVFYVASNVGFIHMKDNLSEEQILVNKSVVQGLTDDYMQIADLKTNSKHYIYAQLYTLLPIVVCIILLTIMISCSVNTIITYQRLRDYSVYHICGMQWKYSLFVNAGISVIQFCFAVLFSVIGIIVCEMMNLLKETVIAFGIWQVITCIVFFMLNLFVSFMLPALIVGHTTPVEVLRNN